MEVFGGDPRFVNPGLEWIRGADALAAADGEGVDRCRALVGFERKRNAPPKPKHDGILVRAADGPRVRARLDDARRAAAAKARAARATKLRARWGAFARSLLSRARLRAAYGA